MIRRFTLSAFALSLSLAAGSLAAADQPPANLHFVAGHWTAWEPPTPPEGAQTYTIVAGDTLWDLAQRFLGNGYLWPQLWEANRYILDAHWIYPGDLLILTTEVTPVEDLTELGKGAGEGEGGAGEEGTGEKGAGEEGSNIVGAETAAGAPVPLGTESDIYCSGYVGDLDETFPYSIVGSEYEALGQNLGHGPGGKQGVYGTIGTVRYGMALGDIVYVDGGRRAGLTPGMVLTAINVSHKVIHPVTGKVVGRLYQYTGRVRILSVQEETAIAEISAACDPVLVGSRLTPFEPEPVPLARRTVMRPPTMPSPAASLADAPVILGARDDLVAMAEDHVVFIDRGLDDQVTPGDVFTIYRLHPKPGMPPVIVGELAVLSVHPHSSVAKIIATRHTVYAGDLLELK
jgi:LysM domain